MTVPKMLALAVAVTAAFTGASAQREPDRMNSAGCRVTGGAIGRVSITDAISDAWVDIATYACGNEVAAGEVEVKNIDRQVAMVARAAAETIAEINVQCAVQGNARVSTRGSAMVSARAVAYGEAVSTLVANSEVCGRCTAVADAISRTSREIVAEAASEVWIDLALVGTGNSRDVIVKEQQAVSHILIETVEDVLASITGEIRAGANDGCAISVINEARVGDYFARCDLDIVGDQRLVQEDSIIELAEQARSFICDDNPAQTNFTIIAQGTARALAEAVAQGEVFCESNGGEDTRACGFVQADVEAIARAQAEAFAEAFADADTCGCALEQYVDAHAFDTIWVEATAEAYAETCASGTQSSFVRDFERNIAERMVVATAQVFVSAVSQARANGDECRIELLSCADVSKCARRNSACRGRGVDGVVPCCDSNYQCVRRTETHSICRNRNSRIPSFYDGRIDNIAVCPEAIL